jgi:hypothetical protein
MYVVKDYMTEETVAVCSRKEDAIAMCQRPSEKDQKLIYEKMK